MEAAWSNEASSSSSSSSSSISTQFKFSGVDTRNNFTSHLLDALGRHGVHTFRDNTKLNRGEYISDALLKAIEGSRISLVVFSKNYAASGHCLDKRVKIMECKKTLQQIVLPIFYNVELSDVRAQKGSLAEAFAKPEERLKDCSDGRVKKWREAFTEVANLSGWDLPKVANGDEACLIQIAVEEIRYRFDCVHLDVACHEIRQESLDYPGKRSRLYPGDVHEEWRHGKVRVVCSEFSNNRPLRNQHQHEEDMVDPNDHSEAVGTGSESTVECQMAGRNFYTLPPSNQVMASIDIDIVTVKAKYQTSTIKFQLSRPWGMAKLEEEVKKRLKELDAGTYLIKYKDEEGEMILIACDEDLQCYIERSRLQDPSTSIVVFLERK